MAFVVVVPLPLVGIESLILTVNANDFAHSVVTHTQWPSDEVGK